MSAIATLGDGAEVDLPALEQDLQRLAGRQLGLEGSGDWDRLDALVARAESDLGPDFGSATTRMLTIAPSVAITALLTLRSATILRDPASRRRLLARLRLRRRPMVPSRPDVVDVSGLSRRRRRASRAFTVRRRALGWMLGFVVLGWAAFAYFLAEDDDQSGLGSLLVVTAIVLLLWFAVGGIIRFFADRHTPELSKMDARPRGYGSFGSRFSVPFIAVMTLSTGLAMLGVAAIAASSIAIGIAQVAVIDLDPQTQALGSFFGGIPLGFSLIAIAVAPANWLRSRRNRALTLAAEGDPRPLPTRRHSTMPLPILCAAHPSTSRHLLPTTKPASSHHLHLRRHRRCRRRRLHLAGAGAVGFRGSRGSASQRCSQYPSPRTSWSTCSAPT